MNKMTSIFIGFMILTLMTGCGAKENVIVENGKNDTVIQSDTTASDTPLDIGISLNGIEGTFWGPGEKTREEPDESNVQYVEISISDDMEITEFVHLPEQEMLLCRMNGSWYEFHAREDAPCWVEVRAEDADGNPSIGVDGLYYHYTEEKVDNIPEVSDIHYVILPMGEDDYNIALAWTRIDEDSLAVYIDDWYVWRINGQE